MSRAGWVEQTVPLYVKARDLKMLRETLCLAQQALNVQVAPRAGELVRLQQLIDAIDRHRPLGSDGKHGNLHTDTCGCEDK